MHAAGGGKAVGREVAAGGRQPSVEWRHAASDVRERASECRVGRAGARLVTPVAAAACDVQETGAAAAAGGRGRRRRLRRTGAAPGTGSGRGRRQHRVRAGPRRRPAPAGRQSRLPLPRPPRAGRAAKASAVHRPALLQPLPLEPPLQTRYVSADDLRNKCT